VIEDLLDARDDLDALLDEALPALAARPTAEGAEVLAVLLTAPGRRTGLEPRLRRLVVRRLEARATAVAAAVLEAVAAIGDDEVAGRARAALERLAQRGVTARIAGVGALELHEAWGVRAGTAEGLAVRVRRPGEPGDRLLKLWLEPGDGQGGLLAGGWTDPLDERALARERERFLRTAATAEVSGEPLEPAAAAAAVDGLLRRAGELDVPLSEGVALVWAQLRRAAGAPGWPPFDVVVVPDAASPRKRRRP
jgi:hypothetical protein